MYFLFLSSLLCLGISLFTFSKKNCPYRIKNKVKNNFIITIHPKNKKQYNLENLKPIFTHSYNLTYIISHILLHEKDTNIQYIDFKFVYNLKKYHLSVDLLTFLNNSHGKDIYLFNYKPRNSSKPVRSFVGAWSQDNDILQDISTDIASYAGPNFTFFNHVPGSLNLFVKTWGYNDSTIKLLDSFGKMHNLSHDDILEWNNDFSLN